MDDLEQQRLESQKLEALAEFAAGAGHEINNPLAIISGRTQLLLREIDHPEHRRQLGIIMAQVKRAYEMIADIRFFARPPKPEWVMFNIIEELKTLVAEQMPLMDEARVTFLAEIDSMEETRNAHGEDPLVEPLVESDPVLLHIAVTILCTNAREAVQLASTSGRPCGTVRLCLCHKEDMWEISVKDDGPGVSEAMRPLIFDPYYSGREAGRGLGFGLPKAWRIMQVLGGSIRCEVDGTFLLTLPGETSPPPRGDSK